MILTKNDILEKMKHKLLSKVGFGISSSENVAVLIVSIKSQSYETTLKTLSSALKDGHHFDVLSHVTSNPEGRHIAAIYDVNDQTKPPNKSDYSQFESTYGEWVVASGGTFEAALPNYDNPASPIIPLYASRSHISCGSNGYVNAVLVKIEASEDGAKFNKAGKDPFIGKTLRVIPPGNVSDTAVESDRLTIFTDENGKITDWGVF
ncbi:MAG: hypothetical protein ABJG88_00295 [Litorimonas sp.]